MSFFSKSGKFVCRTAAIALLSLLASSCQWIYDDVEEADIIGTPQQYINITISVSADNIPATRAPHGGEYDGDENEQGIDTRENEVKKITLIFYQDNTGINTNDDNAEVSFVKTYSVDRVDDYPYSHTHTHTTPEPQGYAAKEIIYSTGDQKMEGQASGMVLPWPPSRSLCRWLQVKR